jgi:hypothetical protein
VMDNPVSLTDPSGLWPEWVKHLFDGGTQPCDQSAGFRFCIVATAHPRPDISNAGWSGLNQYIYRYKKGFGFLPTGTAAVDLGVGKAGVTVQGSAAAGAFVDNKGHPAVGAEASGSVDAYAGQHTAAIPAQDKDSFVVGAFAGVGGGVTLTNAGNAPAMKTMTNTLNIDLGLGPAASISVSSGHSGVSSITITFGFGFGAAVTETNTSTVTAPQ